MIVSVNDQPFRIQFVHSAHDLKNSRGSENPGGLRQIVDNLAASIRRRVTLAEISRIEVLPGATKRAEPVNSYVPVAQGFAICYHGDQFTKEEGRGRSLLRALRLSGWTREQQDNVALQLGYTGGLSELKTRFGSHSAPQFSQKTSVDFPWGPTFA